MLQNYFYIGWPKQADLQEQKGDQNLPRAEGGEANGNE